MERIPDMYRDSVPKLKQKIQTFLTPSVEKVAEHNLQIQKKHIRHLHSEIFWEGSIEIIKTDGTGKALQNVEFLLQYRKDDGKTDEDSEAEYRNLDATVCSNRNLVRNNGIAKTDKNGRITFRGLKLGYKYRLTEIRPLAGTQGLENPITDIELPMLLETKSGNEIKPVAKTQGRFVYVKLKYKISNNTFTMPMTSGNGFFWPGILGLIATGIGGAFWISSGSRNRNSKKKGEYAE